MKWIILLRSVILSQINGILYLNVICSPEKPSYTWAVDNRRYNSYNILDQAIEYTLSERVNIITL